MQRVKYFNLGSLKKTKVTASTGLILIMSFAKEGIPALYTSSGIDSVDHGEEWTKAKKKKFITENYHKPSDEYNSDWDLSGAIDDLLLLFRVGYKLAMESSFPNWKEGCEFKVKRDADMEKARQ